MQGHHCELPVSHVILSKLLGASPHLGIPAFAKGMTVSTLKGY